MLVVQWELAYSEGENEERKEGWRDARKGGKKEGRIKEIRLQRRKEKKTVD